MDGAAIYRPAVGGFWRRHWFLVGLALVAVAGFAAPSAGVALRETRFALPLLTAASLFLSGVTLETRGIGRGLEFRGLALGLASIYLVAPLAAAALAHLLGPPLGAPGSEGRYFFEAMMIVAAQATTIASAPALTLVAGGDQALALSITLASNLATSFVTPTILRFTVGTQVAFPIGRMIREDAIVVLAPVLTGIVLGRFAGRGIAPLRPAIVAASQAIILVFVYTGTSAAGAHLSQTPRTIATFLATAATLHLFLLAWNARASRWLGLPPASRTAVVLCGSQKTLPNGIYLWDTFFPANPHGALALVCYHVFQLVVDGLLLPWLSPTPVAEAEAEVDGA
jgi:sodium/bile acid cotransporter 7